MIPDADDSAGGFMPDPGFPFFVGCIVHGGLLDKLRFGFKGDEHALHADVLALVGQVGIRGARSSG